MISAPLLASFLALRAAGAGPAQTAAATGTVRGAALAEAEAAVRGASASDAGAWVRLGQAYDALGRSAEASAAIERAAALAPEDPRVYHALIAAYWREGRPDKAKAAAEAAKKRCPRCVEVDIELGYFELRDGDARGAAELFDRASRSTAPYVGYHHLATHYGSREGRLREAEALFRKAIALEEQADDREYLVHSLSNLAAVLSESGRRTEASLTADRAVAAARKAAGAGPQLALALVRRAEILREDGRTEEAKQAYLEAAGLLRRSPVREPLDDGGIDVALGELEAGAGDAAAAERHFRRAETVAREAPDPGRWFAARQDLERLYRRAGRAEEAAAANRDTARELRARLAASGPSHRGTLLGFLAETQLEAGDRPGALGTLRRWREAEPGALALGGLYARIGDADDAAAVFRAAIVERPEDLRPRRALARLLREAGSSREAAEVARSVRALCPSCPEFREER